MYTIAPRTKRIARKMGVTVRKSKRKNKKIDVISSKNKVLASVGAIGYKDYASYVKSKGVKYANKKRQAYKKRHAKHRNIKNTPSYWADKLLW